MALARALVREPELLLLDEPFGALDALTRIRMHALVVKLCQSHHPAVLLVTHDVDEAILLADRVLVLTEGRLSLDLAVDLDGPRLRSDPAFGRLRSRLLAELGVDEAAEGASSPPALADVDRPCRSVAPHPPHTRTGDTQMTTTLAPTDLEVTRLSGSIGAVIHGVDLRDADDETIARIRQAWLDHKVVFFPGQHLNRVGTPGFCRPLRRADRGPPGRPER